MHLGEHVTLIFEDELTMRYQIQEMLRIEKTFEEAGIQDELDAYNPLVPDGSNFKATMLIEYEDVDERRAALAQLKGIEDRVWVAGRGLRRRSSRSPTRTCERENEEKTSAVHFLRFELTPEMVAALKYGAALGDRRRPSGVPGADSRGRRRDARRAGRRSRLTLDLPARPAGGISRGNC